MIFSSRLRILILRLIEHHVCQFRFKLGATYQSAKAWKIQPTFLYTCDNVAGEVAIFLPLHVILPEFST